MWELMIVLSRIQEKIEAKAADAGASGTPEGDAREKVLTAIAEAIGDVIADWEANGRRL